MSDKFPAKDAAVVILYLVLCALVIAVFVASMVGAFVLATILVAYLGLTGWQATCVYFFVIVCSGAMFNLYMMNTKRD